MNRLPIYLYPGEFRTMMAWLRKLTNGQSETPLSHQLVSLMVLHQYVSRWQHNRVLGWLERNPGRAYKLNLPLTVAKAMYDELQRSYLTDTEQAILNLLDQAIINHRHPRTSTYPIGDLLVVAHQ